MLRVDDLHFLYGKKKILDGVSFEIESNETISILGPNGVGKTTLIRCLCGVHRPQSGSVEIDGINILDLKGTELAKKIGYVPQYAPRPRTTVYDTVLMGRRPYIDTRISRADIEKVGETIDMMGLSSLSLSYITRISGGEFQKVQIARALVQEPKVLVLDEPTNNLDVSNQHLTMHMIMDAVRSKGVCTLMTMHDINLAIHYSDRLMFFKDGKAAACGGPEIIDEELIKRIYGIDSDIIEHHGVPFVVPRAIDLEHTHR
ncbi:MAG: ABC transporter ATP-binding protein [Methanomassiliicoccaceae archaeon]|jgi:iron complex transport system ATP-binding protein|nr:ABC transporter ATP-binding protein [Methanomassiliicoccaceae archaeon]